MEALMKRIFRYAAAASLAGALSMLAALPVQAAGGRNAAAAVGFAAGAAVGAAATGAAYNNGYYYGDYAYEPAYVGDYAYEPAYVYEPPPVSVAPSYSYDDYYPNRWQDQHSTNNFSISSQR